MSRIVVGLASVIFVLIPKLHPALVLAGGGAAYVLAQAAGFKAL